MNKPRLAAALLLCALLCGCGGSGTESAEAQDAADIPATVPLGGWDYAPGTHAIFLAGDDVSAEELRAALTALPELRKLEYPHCPYDTGTQLALTADYPEVEFHWPVRWAGQEFHSDDEYLDLQGMEQDMDALLGTLPLFPRLKQVELPGWTVSGAEAAALYATFPDTLFRYETELFGRRFDTAAEEIDLSGVEMEDTGALESALVHFPRLRKVDMCDCGLDNETMDALNRRHEGIEFVWIVQVFCHGIRTDATYYTMYNAERYITPGVGTENFRYCHDMIALDLGHSGASTADLAFLSEMPHLQYLIIAECHVDDITVIGELHELTYLEMFLNPVRDLSPLLNCPKLTDLNICYMFALPPECSDILKEMTQLERLWFYGQRLGRERLDELMEALPDCDIQYIWGPESTGGGWRQHEHYYAMRDALHMHYMN